MKIFYYPYIIFCIVYISCTANKQQNKQALALQDSTNVNVPKDMSNNYVISLTNDQLNNAHLQLGQITTRNIGRTIELNGTVDVPPQNLISISNPLGGYLVSSSLLPGELIHKNDIIATMSDFSYVQLQQDYLSAKAKLDFLTKDLERQKELSQLDATSEKTYQQSLSDFQTAKVMLTALKEKLLLININPNSLNINNISNTIHLHSPITGYITKVNINIGKYVNPADVMFEIVDPKDLHAAMYVFEDELKYFKPGVKGVVALSGTDDSSAERAVQVILVTKSVDNMLHTGLIHCHFLETPQGLYPGMFLSGKFYIQDNRSYALPNSAIISFNNMSYIFVMNTTNEYEMTPIKIGNTNNSYTEIEINSQNKYLLSKQIIIENGYALLSKSQNTSDPSE